MDALTQVDRDRRKTLLFSAALLLRILLALTFPALPDVLTGRVEISTPVTSFKRLQEGLFLYERGLDPYDGGIFHQSPLLLSLFSLLHSPATWLGRLISVALFVGLDLLSAHALYDIASSGAAPVSWVYQSPRKHRAWQPVSVAAVYLFNPLTLLACLGRSTNAFTTFFVLLSINQACHAKTTTAAFALASATYLSLHPAFLLPPIGLLCYDRLCQQSVPARSTSGTSTKVAVDRRNMPDALLYSFQLAGGFLLSCTFLLVLSRMLTPSWSFVPSVYLTHLQLPDLTPNAGLWWYFFIEMFDPFRSFFLGVFWLHMLSYSAPLCLRLRKQPLAATVLMMGVIAVFQPYANVGDVGALMGSLCLLSHTFELSSTHRYPLPALTALLYTSLLGPAFHHLWIYAGSGNANFFYAITLVWNLALLILLTDTLYSVLRDEWEAERPEGVGKEVRQI